MALEGGERLVVKTLLDLQGDLNEYVDDARIAATAKMLVEDVRDWLETLEGKGFVERTRLTDGFCACVTASGRLALSQSRPFPASPPSILRKGRVAPPLPCSFPPAVLAAEEGNS